MHANKASDASSLRLAVAYNNVADEKAASSPLEAANISRQQSRQEEVAFAHIPIWIT